MKIKMSRAVEAEGLARKARWLADKLMDEVTKPGGPLYKVQRSRIVCKSFESEEIYVMAESDVEAKEKSVKDRWNVDSVERVADDIII